MDEQIICFKRKLISEHLPQSKVFYDETLWNHILNNLEILSRSKAETNYNYKQLVVYILIKAGNLYLTYKRTKQTKEKRLSQKYSIGIGGHVNIDDIKRLNLLNLNQKFILQAVWREVKEEININSKIMDEPELICFINDDSDDVGKVHFGVVWLLKIKEPNSTKGDELDLGELKFQDLPHLKRKKNYFERWSQLLIDYLIDRVEDKIIL